MQFSSDMKTDCLLWYAELKSPVKVMRKFRAKYGKNEKAPTRASLNAWLNRFKEGGSISRKERVGPQKVDQSLIVQSIQNDPKQSLRRVANQSTCSVTSVRKALKNSGYKRYLPHVVQALKLDDKVTRTNFAQTILDKINASPTFLEKVIFSDEAIFHLEGSINKHNSSFWSQKNPNWVVEKTMHSPKIMVWAAVGAPGIIGPFFLEGNVDGESYLRLLQDEFYPEFSSLPNQSELLFMQDGAPPHWAQPVRDWLNTTLPQMWIGRGSSRDENIPWPPRSPDLTPMDFFVWGFIKSKVYVRNYATLEELKTAIAAAFREITPAMVTATLRNMEKRLRIVIQRKGGHVETK